MAATVVGLRPGSFKPWLVLEVGKSRFRSLFWRVRAEIRRQVDKGRSRKQRFSFHYDPFSYALNFDEGGSGFVFC